MRDIDERIVEMQFENRQFERGANQSISTLEKLRQALHFDDSAKGLTAISSAANKMDLSGIAAGLEAIQSRFSTLGIIGMRVIQNLTDSLMGFASKAVSFATSGILQGGFSRASNIENAKFQIEGLGRSWSEVEKQIDFAVNQTAYGLDSAAKAASMLLASGVKVEATFDGTASTADQMAIALRAISGVAAQTNSDYDSMANIFTTVAGNGRLMGDQLNQLAYRGLNAAAILGRALDKSEEEIRKMTSEGKISFQTFAEVMYQKFGKHAVKANETLTGSLSNVRAALARIGQAFYTPLIEQNGPLVDLFNALRTRVNELKSSLTESNGVIERLVDIAIAAVEKAQKIVEKADFTRIIENLNNALAITKNSFIRLSEVLSPIGEVFHDLFPEKPMETFSKWLGKLKRSITRTSQVGTENGDLVPGLNQKSLKLIEKSAPVLDETVDYVRRIANGVFSGARLGAEAIFAIIEKASPLIDVLKDLGSGFLEVAGRVADWVSSIYDAVGGTDFFAKKVDGIKQFVSGLIEAFERVTGIDVKMPSGQTVIDFFEKIVSAAKDAKQWVSNVIDNINYITGLNIHIPSGQELIDLFERVLQKIIDIKNFLVRVKDSIGAFFSDVHDQIQKVTGIDIHIPSVDELKNAFDKLKESIQKVKDKLRSLVEDEDGNRTNLGQFLDNLKEAFSNFHIDMSGFEEFVKKLKENMSPLETITSFIGGVLQAFFGVLSNIIPFAKAAWDKIADFAKNVFEKIKEIFTNGDLGSALKNSTLALVVFKLKDLFVQINTLFGKNGGKTTVSKLKGIMTAFKSVLDNLAKSVDISRLVIIATAVLELAVALMMLSSVDAEKMGVGLAGLQVIIGDLVGIMIVLSKLDFDRSITKAATALIIMSSAVAILAGAVKSMGKLSLSDLAKGLIGASLMLWELTKVAKTLSDQKDMMKGISGLLLMAVALRIITSAVKSLGKLKLDQVVVGMIAVTLLIHELTKVAVTLAGQNDMMKGVGGLILIAAALKIIASAVKGLGKLPIEQTVMGMIAVTLLIHELTKVAVNLAGQQDMMKGISGVLLIAVAIKILAGAVEGLGQMSFTESLIGIVSFIAIVGVLGTLLEKLANTETNTGRFIGIAASLLIAAAAIKLIASAIITIGNIKADAWTGVGAIAASLVILALAVNAMNDSLKGAAALLIVAAALLPLAVSLKILSTIDGWGIVSAIAALGSALVIFVGVGILVKNLKLESTMIKLAASFTLFSLAAAILGVALVAISAGLGALGPALAIAVTGIVEALRVLLVGLVDLSSDLVTAAGSLLVALAKALIVASPAVVEAIAVIVASILKGLYEIIPMFANFAGDLVLALLQGLAIRIPDIAAAAALIIAGLLSGIAQNIDAIVKGGIDLMVAFVNGMAEGLRNSQGDILAALGNLLSAIIEFSLSALQKILGELPFVGDKIVAGLETAKEKVHEVLAPESMEKVGSDAANAVADGWTGSTSRITKAAKETGDAAKEGLSSKKFDIAGVGQDLSNTFGLAFSGGAGTSFDGGALLSESALSGANSPGDFKDVANIDISAYTSQFEGDFSFAGVDLESSALSGLAGGDQLASRYGLSTANSYANSLDTASAKTKSKRAAVNLAQSAIDGARSKRSGFESVGDYLGSGLNIGLEKKSALLAATAGKMVSNAIGRMRAVAAVASPSKETIKVGGYIGEGLVIGMHKFLDKVENMGGSLSGFALAGIESVSETINNFLDSSIDMDPAIRPVLDLTNIQNGTNALNSMLSSGSYGLALAGNISGFTSSSQASLTNMIEDAVDKAMNSITTKLTDTIGKQNVTIEVPLYMDGREVAKVTAPYTRDMINTIDSRNLRREGIA